MMVPQPTAQYGQVDRVSLARAIFSVRSCAYAGFRSKPKTAAAAPPMVVSFRKSRGEGFMLGPPSARDKVGRVSRNLLNRTCPLACQALILPQRVSIRTRKIPLPRWSRFLQSAGAWESGLECPLRDRIDVTSDRLLSSVILGKRRA